MTPRVAAFLLFIVTLSAIVAAQTQPASQKQNSQTTTTPATPINYSGMYTFLKDGEFIQITIEDQGKVSGFISRYGGSPSDKDAFLDQFIKSGTITGAKLTFATEEVHGVRFEFEGAFDRGPGKTQNDEGYYVLRGKLTRFTTDAEKKTTSQVRQVLFKSFPKDVEQ